MSSLYIKTVKADSGIEYRFVKSSSYVELQYKAKMFPGSLRSEWKYCGDFETLKEAEDYMKKRDAMIQAGDSVML